MRNDQQEHSQVANLQVTASFALRRMDAWVLGLLVLATGVLQVYCARTWHLGYDEFWHIFFGEVEPFSKFLKEVMRDPHPPLHYLILRPLVDIGYDPIWPRLASIIPALLQIPLLFLVLRRLATSRALAFLGCFFLASSFAYTNMAVAVRAYSLMSLFVLTAFWALLGMLDPQRPAARGRIALFLVASAIAFGLNYSVGLVLAAMFAAVLVVTRLDLGLYRSWWRSLRWPELCFALCSMAAVVAYYKYTMSRIEVGFSHLGRHYLAEGESVVDFALRGTAYLLQSFSPLDLQPESVPGSWKVILVGALLLVPLLLLPRYLRRVSAGWHPGRATVILIMLMLWAVLLLLGSKGIYPFGGRPRHQYILFPFMLMFAVLALDEVHAGLRSRGLRGTFIGLALVVAGGSSLLAFQGPDLDDFPTDSEVVFAEEAAELWRLTEAGDAVYFREFCMFGLYGRTRHQGWQFQKTWLDGLDEFEVGEGNGRRLLFRDHFRWVIPQPVDEEFLLRLWQLMQQAGLAKLWVFDQQQKASADLLQRRQRWQKLEALAESLEMSVRAVQYGSKGRMFQVQLR